MDTNNSIKRRILEVLNERYEDNPEPMRRDELSKQLNVEDLKLNVPVRDLNGEGLVETVKTFGAQFLTVNISDKGRRFINGGGSFNESLYRGMTIQINSNSPGATNIVGNNNNLNNRFNEIYQKIENRNPDNKDEIKRIIQNIELELKKKKCDKNKIDRFVELLKQNASWIIPSVIEIVKLYHGK